MKTPPQLTTTKATALTLGKTKSLMNITKKLLEGKSKELTTHDDITIIGNLMWEKESREMEDWYETEKAMNYAKHLRLGGYDDWRLPTIDELVEIVTLCGGVITNEYTDCVDNKNDINMGLVNFKSQKGILKHGYTEQKQVLKRYAHFRT